jgi:uncharacterized membrane protein YtjA (UPF0391 family)
MHDAICRNVAVCNKSQRFVLQIRWHDLGCIRFHNKNREVFMLSWTLIFLIVAVIAGALGFTGVAGAAVGIARVLFTIFIILFLATLVFGLVRG